MANKILGVNDANPVPDELSEDNEAAFDGNIAVIEAIFQDGWTPYPVLPGSGYPAVDLADWEDGLTAKRFRQYWGEHPDHLFRIMRT